MLVRDFMTKGPWTVTPHTTQQLALQTMYAHRVRHLPVVDQGRLVGIISERDLHGSRPLVAHPLSSWDHFFQVAHGSVQKIMATGVVTILADEPVERAAWLLNHYRIGALPVLEDGDLVGMITESDVFRFFCTMLGSDPGYLKLSVADCPEHRGLFNVLAAHPRLYSIIVYRPGHEIVIVLKTPGGVPEALQILAELRQEGLKVDQWKVTDVRRDDPGADVSDHPSQPPANTATPMPIS